MICKLNTLLILCFASALASVVPAQGQNIINTYAGGGPDGAPALSATVPMPEGVAVDGAGNLYIASDSDRIFLVDTSGVVHVFAGDGDGSSLLGDGGPAKKANLGCPCGIARDAKGNQFIADYWNHRIRRVDAATGIITTVAGSGPTGYSGGGYGGDFGPATSALLHFPRGVAVDGSGNLFIADTFNFRVRRIDAATGTITTVAGNGVAGYQGDGLPAILASLGELTSVALDRSENLFIADPDNRRIRRVDAVTGIITTVAGNGQFGYSGDGGPATVATLGRPGGLAVDSQGNFFFSDVTPDDPNPNLSNNRIRRVEAKTGTITTVAGTSARGYSGDGGPATQATLDSPWGLALDSGNNLFVADMNNHRVRRVDAASGIIATVAGDGSTTFGGDGGPATGASLSNPNGVTADIQGNVFLADRENQRVRRVDGSTGIITTVAGNGQAGFSGDGQTATNASLNLLTGTRTSTPTGLAIDAIGNLFIADTFNHRIRRVDAGTGFITTVAGNGQQGFGGDGGPATSASLNFPAGLAVDSAGNLFIADSNNFRIRRVDASSGVITTVAGSGQQTGNLGDGGPATSANIYSLGAAVDTSGNLFIADAGNNRIRRVDAFTGIITTVAGKAHTFGDCSGPYNGPATDACLSIPMGVSLDAGGNLFIAETYIFDCRVLRVDASTGIITDFAGNGDCGFNGDGGPATSARVAPNAVVWSPDGSGNVFITDPGSNRIRVVKPGAP